MHPRPHLTSTFLTPPPFYLPASPANQAAWHEATACMMAMPDEKH